MQRYPYSWVKQSGIIAAECEGQPVLFCGPDCSPDALLEALRVTPYAQLSEISKADFDKCIAETYQLSEGAKQTMDSLTDDMDLSALAEALADEEDLLKSNDGAPVIRLLNAILSEAVEMGASDIHIEPYARKLNVRFRVDGILREILSPPPALGAFLVSRIKVMAKLDIAEKRLPQDGRISLRLGSRNIDVRVSTLPAGQGERVVMRVLDKNSIRLSLPDLGMTSKTQSQLRTILSAPHGIFLVTGPTGSGKSTTLYAALNTISASEKNILTVEDPVEYEMEGIGQTQVNNRVDMTFSRGLRAILRQDPDVVMVGEIRDAETAKIAVQASLTGHLVLSTLHTNTAAGAAERLRDMGVEPFLLASSLTGVLAQRLVRRLCSACKIKLSLSRNDAALWPGVNEHIWQPYGCAECNHTGYRGRTGIHELMMVDDELREAIGRGAGEAELLSLTKSPGRECISLFDDAIAKVNLGITSLAEVLRVTGSENDVVQIHSL